MDYDLAKDPHDALHIMAEPQERCVCKCHGRQMCMQIDYKVGLGCTRLATHDGDHINGWKPHSWANDNKQ